MLHGLTGTCPSEVFGDRTNTIKKRQADNRQRETPGCGGGVGDALSKLPFLCCAVDKEQSDRSLCHPASPMRQKSTLLNYCADEESPGTLRKKPLVLEGARRLGQVTLKNAMPHPKKDLYPSEPSIIETDASSPQKRRAPQLAIQGNWVTMVEQMTGALSASQVGQQTSPQRGHSNEAGTTSYDYASTQNPPSNLNHGSLVNTGSLANNPALTTSKPGKASEMDLTTNGEEVSIASEFDYDAAKYLKKGDEVEAQKSNVRKAECVSIEQIQQHSHHPHPTTSGDQTERKDASKEEVDSVTSSSKSDLSDWQNPKKLLKTIRRQVGQQEAGEFDPFRYFGALDMPVIPSEYEPAHELITKVFNNPLAKKKQPVLSKSRSSRVSRPCKSSQSMHKAAPY